MEGIYESEEQGEKREGGRQTKAGTGGRVTATCKIVLAKHNEELHDNKSDVTLATTFISTCSTRWHQPHLVLRT